MLNSGKNILTLELSGKKILYETKNHNPPLQVKWSFPKHAALRRKSKDWLARNKDDMSEWSDCCFSEIAQYISN